MPSQPDHEVSAPLDQGNSDLAAAGEPRNGSHQDHGRFRAPLEAARHWLLANTFVPSWLPQRWRHPLVSYLGTVVLLAVAIVWDALLIRAFPAFAFQALPVMLLIVFVALNWGAGPGLLATLLGAVLLDYIVVMPQFRWNLVEEADIAGVGLLLVVGFSISVMASRHAYMRRNAERLAKVAETARRQAEELAASLAREHAEARENEVALRAANQRMDEFLAIASHELKTPLTTIRGNIQLAVRRLDRIADEDQPALRVAIEPLAHAEEQVMRLDRLVNDLLDVSRIRANKLDLRLVPADLSAIVRRAVEEQRLAHPERTITLDLPDEGSVPVVADVDRLGEVVTNYLTNALKYSQAECPVQVTLRLEQGQAIVAVRDKGPGLPDAEHARIWEPFHRAEGIRVQSGSGIGLGIGLHISRTIVERHQGQVGVQSAPGKGSTFWFAVPLAVAAPAQGVVSAQQRGRQSGGD